jgi:hypothetical protein
VFVLVVWLDMVCLEVTAMRHELLAWQLPMKLRRCYMSCLHGSFG